MDTHFWIRLTYSEHNPCFTNYFSANCKRHVSSGYGPLFRDICMWIQIIRRNVWTSTCPFEIG
jgi:hypothetical protein